jgi:ATP adenylyltransferase
MAAVRFEGTCEPGVGRAPLPFANAVAKIAALDGPGLEAKYTDLCRSMRLSAGRPFNLLVTRDWMMRVPRAHADLDGIPVNALGFAGALLAKNRDQLEIVRRRGPLAVLRHVATRQ